jgi:hypothetical protein
MISRTYKILFSCICFLFLINALYANELDTNYVKKYKNKLIIGYFQSYRRFEIDVGQKIYKDTLGLSSLKYSSPDNNSSGFDVNYDKISFSFGWKTPVTTADLIRKGRGQSLSFNFAFTLPFIRLETAYSNYKGFYLVNSAQLINDFNNQTPFIQKPSLEIHSGKVKGLMFVNRKKRFSFMSAFSFTERQIKTAGSFFVLASVQFLEVVSKTSIIPVKSQPYYGHFYYDLNHIKSFGYGIAPGYSFNWVLFKGLFFHLTAAVGPEFQVRELLTLNGTGYTQFKIGTVTDIRIGFGFNGKHWFWMFNYLGDKYGLNHPTVKFAVGNISGAATIGFRFGLRQGKLVQLLKENEYYKKL